MTQEKIMEFFRSLPEGDDRFYPNPMLKEKLGISRKHTFKLAEYGLLEYVDIVTNNGTMRAFRMPKSLPSSNNKKRKEGNLKSVNENWR